MILVFYLIKKLSQPSHLSSHIGENNGWKHKDPPQLSFLTLTFSLSFQLCPQNFLLTLSSQSRSAHWTSSLSQFHLNGATSVAVDRRRIWLTVALDDLLFSFFSQVCTSGDDEDFYLVLIGFFIWFDFLLLIGFSCLISPPCLYLLGFVFCNNMKYWILFLLFVFDPTSIRCRFTKIYSLYERQDFLDPHSTVNREFTCDWIWFILSKTQSIMNLHVIE